MRILTKMLWMNLAISATVHADESAFSYNLYSSIRMQAEMVAPDNQQTMSAYRSLRDAYSRVGFHAAYTFSENTSLFTQLELPFDSANFRFRDSYDQGGVGREKAENIRVGLIGLNSQVGTITIGQQWMPYYNAITFPVDQFSSFYSGFATYTTFRVKETLAYESPMLKGFTFGGSYSTGHGNIRSPSRIDDRRIQAVVSYQLTDAMRLAIGMDDRGNASGYKDILYGMTLSHAKGPWSWAVKYEITDTDNPNSFYGDKAQAVNLYSAYSHGKNIYKIMLANVESYGEAIIHLGIDHRINEDFRLFAEFYQEQETAAITKKQAGLDGFDANISGGKLFLLGFRYDLNM
ncbi:porin [Methylophaga sp.]|uniref:porin n=1 Tax=Methylophaga sp. TaxID=2024840 RepID=UPI00271AB0D0|nr:porin [Methylophaga sp.]MDO8825583.1 porin [Methylophaga sp.]